MEKKPGLDQLWIEARRDVDDSHGGSVYAEVGQWRQPFVADEGRDDACDETGVSGWMGQ